MASKFFRALELDKSEAPQVIDEWQRGSKARGKFPRAKLIKGACLLYVCDSPTEPIEPGEELQKLKIEPPYFTVELPGTTFENILTRRRLSVLSGKGAITFSPKVARKVDYPVR